MRRVAPARAIPLVADLLDICQDGVWCMPHPAWMLADGVWCMEAKLHARWGMVHGHQIRMLNGVW